MARLLYPKIKPSSVLYLDVGQGHRLYLETAGNPSGIPVLYLHGGPGGGSSEHHRRYFDPEKYFYISFDQRGCGKSTPSPSCEHNNVEHLIDDIELIRQHLDIEQWLVVGGSWGTTLAMLYGIAHPERVLGFILRGVFLATDTEYQWLYSANGVAKFFPDFYQEFLEPLVYDDKFTPLAGYHRIFSSDNELAKAAASMAWYLWELRLSSLDHSPIVNGVPDEDKHQALCMAQVSSYFFYHSAFIEEDFILKNISHIANIPAIVIHGRYDMVCQLASAHTLCQAWHNASLQILPQAGHSGFERQTVDAMVKATDVMANFLNSSQ